MSHRHRAESSLTLGGNHRLDTLLITSGTRPILGRYEFIREPEQVHLELDSTNHRQVATPRP